MINAVLGKFGYMLSSVNYHLSMESALLRRKISGLNIQTIIDVGASNGSWSAMTNEYFPDAFYFLIEANPVHAEGLLNFKKQHSNIEYILAAAGDSVGEIYFDARDPFGGLASHTQSTPDDIKVPVTTIDEQVIQRSLRPPFFLKLDTHGFELPILKGAENTLKKTNLLVIEAYNFRLTTDSLMFWEMCHHMAEQGFRPIDLCNPMHRPSDLAFWQMDIFFVPAANREFESNLYP